MKVIILQEVDSPSSYYVFNSIYDALNFIPAFSWRKDWYIDTWEFKNNNYSLSERLGCTYIPGKGIDWW